MRIAKYFPMLDAIASMSKDPRTQVACIILDHRGAVRSTGYNGFPRGVDDSPERYADRETKLKLVAHAEANAIANAAAVGTPLQGCILLSNKFPCNECAKLVINAGITTVYAPAPEGSWLESSQIALQMFEEADVLVMYINLLDTTA